MIGIIGGSGVYDLEGLQRVTRRRVETPFGEPSDEYICGSLGGRDVCFLPRHGRGHRLLPSEINHKANVYGFKALGAERVISISAVGSLKENLRPRDIVLPDQYFDRTKKDVEHTFFGNGIVAHIGFSEPCCGELRSSMREAAKQVIAAQPDYANVRVNEGGTYVNMEGPAFSTKAESRVYRGLGFDVIGMTSLPEAKLCREAELCYQAMAMVTDYDCWHESEAPVTVDMILGHLMANTALAKDILRTLIPAIPVTRGCSCGQALKSAIVTSLDTVPAKTLESLKVIAGRYLV
jgi:5'-methylthioadenosine phosphorylase